MKRTSIFSLLLLLAILISCSGSDTYRGLWKATNPEGNRFEINFDAKSFTLKDSLGKTHTYEYSQNSVEIQNGVESYGIRLSDGRAYELQFPKADDESMGALFDDNGNCLYAISRKNFITYEDIYKLD